jgi:hypothetical protein
MGVREKAFAAGLAAAACMLVWAAPAAADEQKPLPPPVPAADDALTDALEDGELTEAEYALERARSLFQLGQVRREFGDVERAGARDATLILRDLAVRLRALPRAERAAARRLLARPDGGGVPIGDGWSEVASATKRALCDAELCVHWVSTSADAPQPTDADADTIPDWVQKTFEVFRSEVWAKEIDEIGFLSPVDDSDSNNNGGGDQFDVYLDDLGFNQVFGYCTSDDPRVDPNSPVYDPAVFAISAYCVVDNDYAATEYGIAHTPLEFLQVTAAHEFHHAIQFAYDWLEDDWLLEGTATNMEETVYPEIDDNIMFLRGFSPLTRPASPLDRAGFGDSEYGSWIFWRYLEEKVAKGNPAIIRQVWERAGFPADDYSLLAVRNVLGSYGTSFQAAFVDFAIQNRRRNYKDGSKYPATPTIRRHTLGPGTPTTGWRGNVLNHLGNHFVSFTPGRSATAESRLRVSVNLPSYGSEATLVRFNQSGTVVVRRLALNRSRDGSATVFFGRGVVKRVDLVLTNRSTRTSCWQDLDDPPFYSCFGTSLDDGKTYRYHGAFIR